LKFLIIIGPTDVTTFAQIRTVRNIPLSQITLNYRLDGVSQELNETFSIELGNLDVSDSNFFPDSSDVTIGHLNGTIIDQDSEFYKRLVSTPPHSGSSA
jgi:hypothetical protein